jgi:hypothetical protein
MQIQRRSSTVQIQVHFFIIITLINLGCKTQDSKSQLFSFASVVRAWFRCYSERVSGMTDECNFCLPKLKRMIKTQGGM